MNNTNMNIKTEVYWEAYSNMCLIIKKRGFEYANRVHIKRYPNNNRLNSEEYRKANGEVDALLRYGW